MTVSSTTGELQVFHRLWYVSFRGIVPFVLLATGPEIHITRALAVPGYDLVGASGLFGVVMPTYVIFFLHDHDIFIITHLA